jgi:acyl-coenzyme A thioesterase PaaI-like protein
LDFVHNPDGSVSAPFDCSAQWEGYPGRVHGGVIAALLDGAMTNCLFAHRAVAVTAELCVRYREAVGSGRPARVRAWLVHSSPRLHELRAELSQAGSVRAVATGKFMPWREGGGR